VDGVIDYVRDGATARITIRRPEKRNALTADMVRQLVDGVERADADDDVKVVLLAGEGPAFCAGFDIADPTSFEGDAGATRRSRVQDVREKASWMQRIFTARKPVIAAVHGPCVGIGTYLVLVSDFAVASNDASFGLPEERFGSAGTTWAYPFLMLDVGLKRATEMVMTGRRYDATEAHQMGLVTRVVARDELDDTADDLAAALASLPRDGIAVSRAVRELALHLTGYLGTFSVHPIAHPLVERMDRGTDEFDFMASVERDGMKAALAERDERFGGDWWGW
jgi:enoyl-CoA hydratase